MKAWTAIGAIAVSSLVIGAASVTLGQESDMPRFTADGSLLRPERWEEWVMVGTSIGLTYTESGAPDMPGTGPGMFHNIYMQPWAYRHFVQTGEFAEKTMFILSMSEPTQRSAPAQGGFYEGERQLNEIHLKQKGLHESGWGFYAFGEGSESAAMIPRAAPCYSCHAEHASFDQVFLQFYPPLRGVKEEK